MARSSLRVSLVAALSVVTLAACAPPSDSGGSGGSSGSDAATATSAADLGGMDALVEAAKKEGELNVIALPPDWANYGAIIKAFADKYGIKVNSAQPDARQPGRDQRRQPAEGQEHARPTCSTSASRVALANTAMFAPYKVATFDDIPDRLQGRRTAPGSTTTAATCRSATTPRKVPPITERQRPAQARVQGQGRAQR